MSFNKFFRCLLFSSFSLVLFVQPGFSADISAAPAVRKHSETSEHVETPEEVRTAGKDTTTEQATTLQDVNTHEYGGRTTFGIAIGGGGLVGLPMRIYMAEKVALEIAVFYRPVIIIGGSANDPGGPMFTGGFDFYCTKRYIPSLNRVSMNGIFIKGGHGFSELITSSMLGFGWAYERFNTKNKANSFSFELGPGVLFNDVKGSDISIEDVQPVLYWKIHWSGVFKSWM